MGLFPNAGFAPLCPEFVCYLIQKVQNSFAILHFFHRRHKRILNKCVESGIREQSLKDGGHES